MKLRNVFLKNKFNFRKILIGFLLTLKGVNAIAEDENAPIDTISDGSTLSLSINFNIPANTEKVFIGSSSSFIYPNSALSCFLLVRSSTHTRIIKALNDYVLTEPTRVERCEHGDKSNVHVFFNFSLKNPNSSAMVTGLSCDVENQTKGVMTDAQTIGALENALTNDSIEDLFSIHFPDPQIIEH